MNLHEKTVEDIIKIAEMILAKEIDAIEGVRLICDLRFSLSDPEDELFLPLRAIESETDSFPVGSVRSSFGKEYLQCADIRKAQYLNDMSTYVTQACREIVATLSTSTSD